MTSLFRLARKAWRPTSLSALVLFILFLVLKIITSADIFSTLGEENTFRLLNNVALGLLTLAALALALGIVAFVLTKRTPTLEGNTRFEDGNPVFGAVITIEGVKGEETTDRNGRFEIQAPSRDSWVIVAQYGHEVIRRSVVKEGARDPITMTFPSLPQEKLVIKGNVISLDGHPVQGAAVYAIGRKGEESTDRIGYFELEVDQRESWTVVAQFEGKTALKRVARTQVQMVQTLELPGNRQDAHDEPSGPVPTFEIGECTDGSPFQMECTGEIVRGAPAAKRVVEEIQASGHKRFEVSVTGLARIESYLAEMTDPQGEEIEIRHELQRCLESWEKQRDLFRIGVEYVLWHSVFRRTAYIYDSESAADVICAFSRHCFEIVSDAVLWYLWYGNDQNTLCKFFVTPAIQSSMNERYYETVHRGQGPRSHTLYQVAYFDPDVQHSHVLPPLLMFICERKLERVSQVTIDEYLDVSQWNWSINDPHEFLWKG